MFDWRKVDHVVDSDLARTKQCLACGRTYKGHHRTKYCYTCSAFSGVIAQHRGRASRHFDLTEHFTIDEWVKVCIKHGWKCLSCGSADIVPDHVIPLALGGPNTIDNIQPLCRICNSQKHSRIIDYRPD